MIHYKTITSAEIAIKHDVGTEQQRKNLIQQAWLHKSNYPTIPNTNEKCWRSNFKYENIEWLLNEINKNLNEIISYYLDIDKSYASRLYRTSNTITYWTNINEPYSSNRLHTHKQDAFSAVYYLQANQTGEITFYNSANIMNECNLNSPFVSRMSFEPKDGDLFIWPSWIPHEVECNRSNQYRINIAFNINL